MPDLRIRSPPLTMRESNSAIAVLIIQEGKVFMSRPAFRVLNVDAQRCRAAFFASRIRNKILFIGLFSSAFFYHDLIEVNS